MDKEKQRKMSQDLCEHEFEWKYSLDSGFHWYKCKHCGLGKSEDSSG